MTTYIAWATTSESMPEADPGIGIQQIERADDGYPDYADVIDWAAEAEQWALDADGRFDDDAADESLAAMGWTRTGPWTDSGGQWAAEVTRHVPA